MGDPFRQLLESSRRVAVAEALSPWLGWSLQEAVEYRRDPSSQDGLSSERYRDLMKKAASRIPGCVNPILTAGLLRTYGPCAEDAQWLLRCMAAVSCWVDSVDEEFFYDAIAAHRSYEDALKTDPTTATLPKRISARDRIRAPLGCDLAIEIEIASDRWLIGAVLPDRTLLHYHSIRFDPDDRGPDDDTGPRPSPILPQLPVFS